MVEDEGAEEERGGDMRDRMRCREVLPRRARP